MIDRQKKLRFWSEVLGLYPFPEKWKQIKIAIRGGDHLPKSKAGISSLKQLHPRISPRMWLGKQKVKRKVIISNLFNHTPTPIEEGWSVAKTQVKDFRGGTLTYDSHNGTDFAVPVSTIIHTAAPGQVVYIVSEYNRGGLKMFIDNGSGIMTTYAHLARTLVKEGEYIERNQPIAISGYSGLDALITFPFGIPHTHFNVWHNCKSVDPFSYEGNISLWREGNIPIPARDENLDFEFVPSEYDEKSVQEVIANCLTPSLKEKLLNIEDFRHQAALTLINMIYYPTRFALKKNLYKENFERKSFLDLPFSSKEFDGVIFLDEIKLDFWGRYLNRNSENLMLKI